jgi:SAM-dependent methyltransferase
MSAFWQLHRDLEREGPGTADDVAWALALAGTPGVSRILDIACGPGADSVTMAELRPEATVLAIDKTAHFVAEAARRLAPFGARARSLQADMARPDGPADLIWCAGALYFLGVTEGLRGWKSALAPQGKIAFSEPCFTSSAPSDVARQFWADYPFVSGPEGIASRVDAAGYRVLGHRMVIGQGWADYYGPMQKRIAVLRQAVRDGTAPVAGMTQVLDEAELEITQWQTVPDEIAYALFVVEPL